MPRCVCVHGSSSGSAAMGNAMNSAPTQEHVVTLHPHVSRKVQEAMMDQLRARGVRIGLVAYSPPLGFVADITKEERMHILADENVASVVNDEERPDDEEEVENLWLHMLLCGDSRPLLCGFHARRSRPHPLHRRAPPSSTGS